MTEIRIDPTGWDGAVSDTDGPQLIVAGPGAGKTEFLARRARHLIRERGVAPESVLLLSFSRRGAADLRDRVLSALDRSFASMAAWTFHSLAIRLVEAHGAAGDWPEVPTLLTGPEHVSLVAELLAEEDAADWPLPHRGLLTSRAFAEEVADFGLRASERLVGPNDLTAFERADWRGLPGFFARYRRVLVERFRIDYGSLQVEALRLLEDPTIATRVADQFQYVLVDEYQDTTFAQAQMAERIAAGHRNLTVAGDPYQSIYSFRGAELSNIADFPERFPGTDGAPARRIVLTTSFRVPRAILDAAVRLTEGAGLPGSAGPVEPASGEGSVETYGFDQQTAEAEWIASELQRMHLRDGTPYQRMGILVRSKRRFLPELSRSLDRRNIPHQRPDTRLADHRAVRPVLDLAEAASGSTDSRVLRRILMGPLVGLTLAATRELERQAIRSGWEDALQETPTARFVGALLADPAWASEQPAIEGFWHLWTTLERLPAMALGDDGDRAALASFSQALERMEERDPTATLADYAVLARSEDFEAEPLISFRRTDEDRVTLTTLHQAKGMEFDIVVIADAREGVLPDLRARDSLLGTRHLSPSQGGNDRDYRRFRLQEERRLAYTAMCRGRTRVIWTCTVGADDDEGRGPSRFLALAAGRPHDADLKTPEERTMPTTPLEGEAWLRRMLADPLNPAADRLAALGVLAESAPWQPRPISAFSGVLPRGPAHGLVPEGATLSPSQAESFMTCGLRYAYERRLRIGAGGSLYAELGSLIHDVLEVVERAAVRAGRERSDLGEALDELGARFDPADFGGVPWADSWKRRAERILGHLYQFWPGKGPAESFEQWVELEVDGVLWRGRVDRAERRDDAIHIVDYKTGTSLPSTKEAAEAVQLGFYVLATEGKVGGAEFWYPASDIGTRQSVAVRRFEMARLPKVQAAMAEAQEGIFDERWEPTPGDHCDRCAIRIVCPAWPEGREAYSS